MSERKLTRFGAIMAGGSGERFWPLSRRMRPKQLITLPGADYTLLGEAVERAIPIVGAENLLIVTSLHLVENVARACPRLPANNVIAEPMQRNTGGCLIYLAAWLIAQGHDPSRSTLAVMTADHRIGPQDAFERTSKAALDIAENEGALVTIGIRPTRPETGFGYIEANHERPIGKGFEVTRFHEKPSADLAQDYFESSHFLWNSGMFFWRLDAFVAAVEQCAPTHARALQELVSAFREGRCEDVERIFAALPSISIDYLVMERAKNVAVVEAEFEWDDVGSWDAFARYLPSDSRGNARQGEAVLFKTADCMVYNTSRNLTLCLAGVYDLMVVATDDAVLIVDKDHAQSVKEVVKALRERDSPVL